VTSTILSLVASVLATAVAIAFAWLVGKGLDWMRRHARD
jgi:uncharacterized membrane protein (DUF441 family)